MLLFRRVNRPNNPFVVQWRKDGARKQKAFETEDEQIEFAKDLSAGVGQIGLAAYQLNPDEAREWRAFKAEIGSDVPLSAVRDCWLRHGKRTEPLLVRDAATIFTDSKTAEGVAATTVAHYRPIFARLNSAMGRVDVNAVTRDALDEWVSKLAGSEYTKRTHQKLIQNFFGWLKKNRRITENPCDGLRPVRIVPEEVEAFTVDEVCSLFAKNESQPRELCGRLALECFAGLRYSSAARLNGATDIRFDTRQIILPAKSIKTRRREVIDKLPANLWWWLEWSNPATWSMTERQYLEAKSNATRIRAELRLVHNGCRHSFATYHVAAFSDAARTALILCHTNQAMLFKHYRGIATEADGLAYFEICPSNWCSPWPRAS
jgi:site-specific recombinase XerC